MFKSAMTLRRHFPDTDRVITVTNKIGLPDDRSSFVRGPAAQADRGLSRGGFGLCRGDARSPRQAGGGLRDGRGACPGPRPVGPPPRSFLARAVQHRRLPGAAGRCVRAGAGRPIAALGLALAACRKSPDRDRAILVALGEFRLQPQDRPAGVRADVRHARLRLARIARRARRPVRIPIWPRRRWRMPGPSSLLWI